MEFIGRKDEIKTINNILALKDSFASCLIYGRRRLGKTELVNHCLRSKNIKTIIFQCTQSSEEQNTLSLTMLIKKVFKTDYIYFDKLDAAIEYLFNRSIEEEIYFAIDEYPYIRELISGFDSIMQKLIDKYHNSSKMKLFILGSSISIMQNMQNINSPLYQRFNVTLELKQMNYLDSSKFYKSFSNEDKVRLYSVFGGVPFYNRLINDKESVKDNIIRLMSSPLANFTNDYQIYLREELRKINSANQIFLAIASGAFHYNDILNKSHIDKSATLSVTLNKLINMDLISYVSPINDKNNKKKSGYIISDNSLNFYFRFIYGNSSSKAVMDENDFYDEFVNDEFESSYVPTIFENIAKQYIVMQNKNRLIKPAYTDIGTYWYDDPINKKNGQFDIVASSKNGYVFYECKYLKIPITDSMIASEIEQVKSTSLETYNYGFVSKSGFNLKNTYPYYLITLDDLYNEI